MDPAQKQVAISADRYPAYRAKLISSAVATEVQLSQIEAEFQAEIDQAVAFALQSAYPGLEELTSDVYGASVA
jgi:TPP-dependent pyruvate/acetoin dehydrogenase alpha subunit